MNNVTIWPVYVVLGGLDLLAIAVAVVYIAAAVA